VAQEQRLLEHKFMRHWHNARGQPLSTGGNGLGLNARIGIHHRRQILLLDAMMPERWRNAPALIAETRNARARWRLRVYQRWAWSWPLEAKACAILSLEGLEEIIAGGRKAATLIETQMKKRLVQTWREDVRPRIVGKFDDKEVSGACPTTDWVASGHQ